MRVALKRSTSKSDLRKRSRDAFHDKSTPQTSKSEIDKMHARFGYNFVEGVLGGPTTFVQVSA